MTRTIVIAGTFILILAGAAYIAVLAIIDDGAEREDVGERVMQIQVNEKNAVAALRELAFVQARLHASGRVDEDGDGYGEYGGIRELSGAVNGRMGRALKPPLLDVMWRSTLEDGTALIGGYRFRVFLPGSEDAAVGEPAGGYGRKQVDVDGAETHWCCYAWPNRYGRSGRRSFFVNERAEVLEAPSARYSGTDPQPSAGAAFLQMEGRTIEQLGDELALQSAGHDGHHWRQLFEWA